MFAEDELLPISALQHLLFCERRAALTLIECVWEDNVFTVKGSLFHTKTHEETATEVRGDVRVARGLRILSLRLGLSGKTDVVEFHREEESSTPSLGQAAKLPGVEGYWRPFPVEYKRGRLRHEEGYEVQLCAQAICLEEMLGEAVTSGAIFYGETNRRLDVAFTRELRSQTEAAAARLHELIRSGVTPAAKHEKKCERCSLMPLCLPGTVGGRRSAREYVARAFSGDPQ